MAGTATHLAIADKIVETLPAGIITDLPAFYSGNIAPDAVHSRAGYTREMKKHTHLTTGLSGGDFTIPEKLEVFHGRLSEFIEKYYRPGSPDCDLYLGYVAHLVTDEYFNIHIRSKCEQRMKEEGITKDDPEFARRILRDMDRVDAVIVGKYPFKNDVRALLGGIWDCEIRDMVTPEETNASKTWVINKLFDSTAPEKDPQYYSYDEALEFIEIVSFAIIERFSGGKDFPRLFEAD